MPDAPLMFDDVSFLVVEDGACVPPGNGPPYHRVYLPCE